MTSINFLDVVPGDRIVLLDGAEIVVTHNPDDGLWLFGQYLSHPDKPSMVDGCEHSIFAHDVKEVLSAGGDPK